MSTSPEPPNRDDTGDLPIGDWPPAGTVLSLRRRWRTGKTYSWVVVRDGTQLHVHAFAHRRGRWTKQSVTPVRASLPELLGAVPALGEIRRGTISEYVTDPAVIPAERLARMLHVRFTGGAEPSDDWPEDLCGAWPDDGEYIDGLFPAVDWVHRWVSINERFRLSGARLGRTVVPVLVDLADEALVPRRVLAEHRWFSESGGAPISWDGGNAVDLLADNLAHERWWGDLEAQDRLFRLPRSDAGLARMLAEWIVRAEAHAAAALRLEPLDPDGVLTADQREAWLHALGAVTVSLDLDIAPATATRLRRLLAGDSPAYLQVRDGLSRPTSPQGQVLLATLRGIAEGEPIGGLVYGGWADRAGEYGGRRQR